MGKCNITKSQTDRIYKGAPKVYKSVLAFRERCGYMNTHTHTHMLHMQMHMRMQMQMHMRMHMCLGLRSHTRRMDGVGESRRELLEEAVSRVFRRWAAAHLSIGWQGAKRGGERPPWQRGQRESFERLAARAGLEQC